ncbi:MAG: alpha/beta fold hydrolase [Oscillochloridaceae bacterium]|nr:alpha/beta fold hydrolase [Chloroflexaceae bacterium]MDW8388958.1 alpha/beta fold hydrolase [Oscillochloridaceae bacterium]
MSAPRDRRLAAAKQVAAPALGRWPARLARTLAGLAGLAAISAGLWLLFTSRAPLAGIERLTLGATPVTVYRPAVAGPAPAVVIAHGFAASQQIMEPFALTLARNGYLALTFDFPGHGRNTAPLRGDLADREGRYRQLRTALDAVVAYARERGDGRVGLVGHSMGSEAVARYAMEQPDIAATVAVSLVYEGTTATRPANLLVLTGALEGGLQPLAEAVIVEAAGAAGVPGETYGDPAAGTGRRVVFVPGAEHIGVLFHPVSMAETLGWFQAAMPLRAMPPPGAGVLDNRLPALGLVYIGAVLLYWPLVRLLQPIGPLGGQTAPFPRRGWWATALAPALLAPLLLRLIPAGDLLPIRVGGPLALFFGLYGLLTAAGLAALTRGRRAAWSGLAAWRRGLLMAVAAALLVVGYVLLSFGVPTHLFVLNYFPPPPRWPVFLAVFAAMLPYFLADERLTRGAGAPRGAYVLTKGAFFGGLILAIVLNPRELFFLVLIAPLFVVYFVIYGLLSGLVHRQTRTIVVGALVNAVLFAWIVAATFPLT